MSDDKAVLLAVSSVCLAFLLLCGKGCDAQHRTQAVRAQSKTVTTCVEHSVLDRVQVVQ